MADISGDDVDSLQHDLVFQEVLMASLDPTSINYHYDKAVIEARVNDLRQQLNQNLPPEFQHLAPTNHGSSPSIHAHHAQSSPDSLPEDNWNLSGPSPGNSRTVGVGSNYSSDDRLRLRGGGASTIPRRPSRDSHYLAPTPVNSQKRAWEPDPHPPSRTSKSRRTTPFQSPAHSSPSTPGGTYSPGSYSLNGAAPHRDFTNSSLQHPRPQRPGPPEFYGLSRSPAPQSLRGNPFGFGQQTSALAPPLSYPSGTGIGRGLNASGNLGGTSTYGSTYSSISQPNAQSSYANPSAGDQFGRSGGSGQQYQFGYPNSRVSQPTQYGTAAPQTTSNFGTYGTTYPATYSTAAPASTPIPAPHASGFNANDFLDLTSDQNDFDISSLGVNEPADYPYQAQQIQSLPFRTHNQMLDFSPLPQDPFADLDDHYTGQQNSNGGPTYGQYSREVPSQQVSQMQNTPNLAVTDRPSVQMTTQAASANDPHQPSSRSLWNSVHLLGQGAAQAVVDAAAQVYDGTMDILQAPAALDTNREINNGRFGYLYNDSSLSVEEINTLLENIRPDEELPAHLREDTPEAMSVRLMEHQKLGLQWLKKMEEGSNKGGILADDMGLGKTVQALALMVSRPSEDPGRKTTLIVAPVALMKQWESEIRNKLKPSHRLRVGVYYSSKRPPFSELRTYDVVLTTYGTLSSEGKKRDEYDERRKSFPNVPSMQQHRMSLIGDECKWYRVILDEAQCIKNPSTRTAKAAYRLQARTRFCMTGTPMMNNLLELQSLIGFLRIRPYNSITEFKRDFRVLTGKKQSWQDEQEQELQRIRAVLRSISLRRTKTSKVDDRPILTLPEKHISTVTAVFNQDERDIYKQLEERQVATFNRYLKAGTVMKNYAHVLVMLLRLRQLCDHPKLIVEHSPPGSDTSKEQMMDLAKKFDQVVVTRIQDLKGDLQCCVCLDVAECALIFYPCGHFTCSECFTNLVDPRAGIEHGEDRNATEAKCPICRAQVDPKKIVDYGTFRKVHFPTEADLAEDVKPKLEDDSDSYSGSASEAEEEGKRAKASTKTNTLAVLRQEGMRNAASKKVYLKRLRRDWVPSTKIERCMELLTHVNTNDPREKTIIFSQFTSLLDLLEIPISDKGWKYRRYDGSMNPTERDQAVNDFKDQYGGCNIMLISLRAGNAGLNLTEASQVIIFDPFWNPFVEDQAIDRAYRIGQSKEVHVHRLLIEESIEDRIVKLQESKRELITAALDENASKGLAKLDLQQLRYLFTGRGMFGR